MVGIIINDADLITGKPEKITTHKVELVKLLFNSILLLIL